MIEKEKHIKIVTCPRCEGTGYTRIYNERERGYDDEICSECDGIRVVTKIISVEYMKVINDK